MKHIRKLLSALLGLLPLLVVAQDFDDVYFTKADRIELEASRRDRQERNAVSERRSESAQSKFTNPDYQGEVSNYTPSYNYYREEELSRFNNSNQIWNNRFMPAMSMGFSPMMMNGMAMGFGTGFYDPFWGGFSPMMGWNRFGWRNSFGWGWNRFGWNRFGGIYDPFWNGFTGWNRFGNPYYCPPVVAVGGRNPGRVFRTTAARYNRSTSTRTGASRYNRTPNIDSNGRATSPTRSRSRSNSSWDRRERSTSNPSYTPRRSRSSSGSSGSSRPSYSPRRSSGGSSGGSRRSGGGSSRRRGGGS